MQEKNYASVLSLAYIFVLFFFFFYIFFLLLLFFLSFSFLSLAFASVCFYIYFSFLFSFAPVMSHRNLSLFILGPAFSFINPHLFFHCIHKAFLPPGESIANLLSMWSSSPLHVATTLHSRIFGFIIVSSHSLHESVSCHATLSLSALLFVMLITVNPLTPD